MSAKDLLGLVPVPGLDAAVTLLNATYSNIQKIGVCRRQCEDMAGRAVALLLKVRDVPKELVGTRAQALADELEPVLQRIMTKTSLWASWGPLKCFFQQSELEEDLARLQKQLDGAILTFGVAMNLQLQRSMYRSEAIHRATREEFRAGLQAILDDHNELRKLWATEPPPRVEQVMMHLQNELRDPDIPEEQRESFGKGLWDLHNKTQKLPPLTDLTGQVELNDRHPQFIGTYNDVYKGTWLGKEEVAVRLPRTLSDTAVVRKKFQDEVEIWRTFDHPNVLPLYGITYIGNHLYSVSPWMKFGTAISFVEREPQTNVLKLLSEITEGLAYLHSRGIVHGDLRGANVLISEDRVARLSDFGLSKFLENCNRGLTSASSINPRWVAPEVVRELPLSKESDIWSLGMTFLELLTRQQPYSNIGHDFNVLGELKKYNPPKRPTDQAVIDAGLNEDMWKLLKQCWKKPEQRPTIQDVKSSLARIRSGDPIATPSSGLRSMMSMTGMTKRKGTSSRPGTATSQASEGSSGKSIGRISTGLSGLNIQASTLSPTSYASTSPASWNSHSPSSSYSPNPAYSPIQPHRRTSHTSESQSPPNLSGFANSRSSFGSAAGHSDGLTMEHSAAPRLPLLHLERDWSTYQPRIPTRAYTDSSYSHHATANSIMTIESVNQEPLLQEAIASEDAVVYVNSQTGDVIAGTLNGLVERLINNFNMQKDERFREVILAACVDLVEPDDLLGMLITRFHEAEVDNLRHPQDRTTSQHNVFKVLHYWLSSRQVPVKSQLLHQMREFCEEALQMKVSPTMVERVTGLLDLINIRLRQDSVGTTILTPGRRIMPASEVTPKGLAIAMTILEGDKYKAILPCDYLADQCGRRGFDRVGDAASTNNRIIQWTKQSLLHWDAFQQRAAVLKFYITTAQELRKLRNYHSLVAIAIALGSCSVSSLGVTREYLNDRQMAQYEELVQLTDPEGNHSRYRQALKEVPDPAYADYCIPWIAVHLKELHSVLHANKRAIMVKNRPLINFQRYNLFMDKLQEVLSYPPPDLERYRDGGELVYLEEKLKHVTLGEAAEEQIHSRGEALREIEKRPHTTRVARAGMLGMTLTKAGQGIVNGHPGRPESR
ncbi:hypothetical protein NMY22_g1270 [Coprinellus aureogranulatus]|nr:hypothetical protein NMY22_g1270 [Coprinellus aureogranulatus]